MHSKVAVIVDKTGPIRALIGSHNWTYMALRGFNGEASVVARGVETDRVIINTRAHVEATIAECEVFDPDRIEFYKEVQTRLHRGPQQNENIIVYPSYVQRRVLVVHAEVHDASLLREQSLQLYLPLGFAPERDLPVGTAVEVYLYEPETLFGHPPTSTPVLFVGDLVTSNRIESGRITGKEIDSAISDQNLPVVDRTTDLPTNRPVGFECVAKVKSKGRSRTRIYHAKEAKPGTKVSLAYEEAKDPRPALSDGGRSDIKEYLYSGDATFKQPIGETEESTLLVPRADLVYDENPYWRLAQKLGKGRGSEGLRRRAAAQKSEAAEKAPHREWETPYIYFAEGSIDDSAE